MKLRSIVSVGVMALAVAAVADYTDGKVCGWMRVDSDLAVTVVGVPWVDVADPSTDVKVADLVKTDNLTDGDNLYVYNNGTWTFYTLSSGAWIAGTTVNSSVTPVAAGTPETARLARGQALYLERQNPTEGGVAKPFYVYGAEGTALTTKTLSGAAGTKFLVASPKAAVFQVTTSNISGATPKSRSASGDQIIVPLTGGASRTYTLASGKWGYVSDGVRVKEGDAGYLPIALGTGFWYIKSGAGDVTITW